MHNKSQIKKKYIEILNERRLGSNSKGLSKVMV